MASRLYLAAIVLTVAGAAGADDAWPQNLATRILQAGEFQGGLIVQIGCGDGRLTTALGKGENRLVHGLALDQVSLDAARKHVKAAGLYGRVSIDLLPEGHLPYADNMVNLVVVSTVEDRVPGIKCRVSDEEIQRILAPGGVVIGCPPGPRNPTPEPRFRKPWPDDIDQWTHFLYDSTNNAVCHDVVVDVPHHLQWVGDPQYARSHDHLASISAVVSAGGRIFYIADEAPAAVAALPGQWNLVARDAFNGVLLWKLPIPVWEGHLRGFRTGPTELPRRLVAVDDRLFVTLGYGQPVCCLDAATGHVLKTYPESRDALEIVYLDGILYVVTGKLDPDEVARRRDGSPPPSGKALLAIDVESGKTLWQKSGADTAMLMPLTMAIADDRVYYQNTAAVVCLDAASGEVNWQTPRPIARNRWTWSTPTLVVYDDVVLSADRVANSAVDSSDDQNAKTERADDIDWVVSSRGGEAPDGELIAYSAADGSELWRCACRETYNAPPDVLVVDGLVWSGEIVRARDPGITVARDVHTGEIKRERPADQEFFRFGMGHHRCYRNKATDRFLLMGRSGIELLDVDTGQITANHFVRGACQYGIVGCNGLLYAPPHSCACFIQAKLTGFNALASKASRTPVQPVPDDQRLIRGPAYAAASLPPADFSLQTSSWPTYRRDPARTGRAAAAIPTPSKQLWQTEIGGSLTPPVIADGRLFVADTDGHTVYALDGNNGQKLWSFTAGGRIDSPPTVYQGQVYLGSADGYAYCLRASDGELAWKFLGAPTDQRIVCYGQLESAWPVPGNILVVEPSGEPPFACFVAGRSSYLDGGLWLYRVNPNSGELLSKTAINNLDEETGVAPQFEARGVNMPGALPDVLSSDGESLYLRHLRFDLQGSPLTPDVAHLYSPAGFMDDAWWHRNYWIYGTDMGSGWGGWTQVGYQVPAGRLMVLDDDSIYAFGRLNQYATHGAHVGIPRTLLPWPSDDRDGRARGQTHYALFATKQVPEVQQVVVGLDQTEQTSREGDAAVRAGAKPKQQPRLVSQWARELDVTVRAMVLAGETLYVAGPPELLSLTNRTLDEQDLNAVAEAYAGKRGGTLWSVSTHDGATLAEQPLESPPVFDGLIAAVGRLYLVTMDGRVSCLGAP